MNCTPPPEGFFCEVGNYTIPISLVCDGTPQCIDHTDEEDCAGLCEPFIYMSGSCVFIDYLTKATWDNAQEYCEMIGSSLIKIDDIQLWSDVISYVYQNTSVSRKEFWFGAKRPSSTGNWSWTDGSPVMSGPPLWYPGRPTGTSNYDCTYTIDPTMNLINYPCNYDKHFICQHEPSKTLTAEQIKKFHEHTNYY